MNILGDLEARLSRIEAEEYGMGWKESLVILVCAAIALGAFVVCAAVSTVAVVCTYVGACALMGVN